MRRSAPLQPAWGRGDIIAASFCCFLARNSLWEGFCSDRAWGCKQMKVWDFISLFFALKFDFLESWFSDDRTKRALAETPALHIECYWIVTVLQLQCQTPVISVEERRARRTCWPQQSSSPNWRRSDSSNNNTHTPWNVFSCMLTLQNNDVFALYFCLVFQYKYFNILKSRYINFRSRTSQNRTKSIVYHWKMHA